MSGPTICLAALMFIHIMCSRSPCEGVDFETLLDKVHAVLPASIPAPEVPKGAVSSSGSDKSLGTDKSGFKWLSCLITGAEDTATFKTTHHCQSLEELVKTYQELTAIPSKQKNAFDNDFDAMVKDSSFFRRESSEECEDCRNFAKTKRAINAGFRHSLYTDCVINPFHLILRETVKIGKSGKTLFEATYHAENPVKENTAKGRYSAEDPVKENTAGGRISEEVKNGNFILVAEETTISDKIAKFAKLLAERRSAKVENAEKAMQEIDKHMSDSRKAEGATIELSDDSNGTITIAVTITEKAFPDRECGSLYLTFNSDNQLDVQFRSEENK